MEIVQCKVDKKFNQVKLNISYFWNQELLNMLLSPSSPINTFLEKQAFKSPNLTDFRNVLSSNQKQLWARHPLCFTACLYLIWDVLLSTKPPAPPPEFSPEGQSPQVGRGHVYSRVRKVVTFVACRACRWHGRAKLVKLTTLQPSFGAQLKMQINV